jgi:transposase
MCQHSGVNWNVLEKEEPMPQCKIISVDLAKDVYEVALANQSRRIVDRKRLNRRAFQKLLVMQPASLVLFEACGTAHYWARVAQDAGHTAKIIPAQYVCPYRRRNKTDRADAEALIEAHRCEGIKPVPVRSVEQQQIQQLHRLREQWKKARTARINFLRGCLRELGIFIPVGARRAVIGAREAIDSEALPLPLAAMFRVVLDEVAFYESAISDLETQIAALTTKSAAVRTLRSVQGVGLLTSTALVAAAGSPSHFASGRHMAASLGLTPREYSSGNKRYIGRMSKQGDPYVRTLLIHGARSVLIHARSKHRAGKSLNRLERWAVKVHDRVGHNKAAVALANKLARICWATWKREQDCDGSHVSRVAA